MKDDKKMKTVIVENHTGVSAADYSPTRAWLNWPLDRNVETSSFALERIWKRARSLYANCSEVRFAVNTLASMVGTLSPRPNSGNEEWDKLAREAFLKRVSSPHLFDANANFSWNQAQLMLERRAIIDGDILTVLVTDSKTGAGQVQFYAAPQITGNGKYESRDNTGVVKDRNGTVKGYYIYNWDSQKPFFVAANRSILYRHNAEPGQFRGASELISCISTAQDVTDILGYTKASAKLASLFGLIEEQSETAKSNIADLAMLRNPGRAGTTTTTTEPVQPQATPTLGLALGETRAITLSPGHKLSVLHDNRPANEVQEFIKRLVDSIALAVGVDSSLLYHPESMNSASTRFVIAKSKDLINQRLNDKILWCNKIYQFILSCEVAAGRLPKCPVEGDAWSRVQWVSTGKWSIDLGRDAQSAQNLIARGLMSADAYCLENFGLTSEEIFEQNLHSIAHNMEKAKEAGIPYELVVAPQAGSTYVPESGSYSVPEKPAEEDDDGLVEGR